MGLLTSIKDTFFGGAEKKAGKKAAAGQQAAADMYGDLVPRVEKTFEPYQTAATNAFAQYQEGINKPAEALPEFNYSGSMPQFNYGGSMPQFNYGGTTTSAATLPEYASNGQFNFDPSQMENNPAYKFNLEQGLQAVNRGAGASGNLNSGNRLLELQRTGAGIASNEYGNEFARQLQASQENYGRTVNDFGINKGNVLDQYNLNKDAETSAFGRATDAYGINRQAETDQYGRAVDQYGRDTTQEGNAYARAVQGYGFDTDRATMEYNQNQNYMAQLAQLSAMGFDITQLLANLDLQATTGGANAKIGKGQAQAAGIIGGANAIRGTIGDIAKGVGFATAGGVNLPGSGGTATSVPI